VEEADGIVKEVEVVGSEAEVLRRCF